MKSRCFRGLNHPPSKMHCSRCGCWAHRRVLEAPKALPVAGGTAMCTPESGPRWLPERAWWWHSVDTSSAAEPFWLILTENLDGSLVWISCGLEPKSWLWTSSDFGKTPVWIQVHSCNRLKDWSQTLDQNVPRLWGSSQPVFDAGIITRMKYCPYGGILLVFFP